MKRLLILSVCLGCYSSASDSIHLLEKNEWEVGMVRPIRYGLGSGREISAYKLLSLKMPNITYTKLRWRKFDWNIATQHSLYYPTPLLQWFQSPLGMDIGEPNMFSLISPEFDIPQMVSFWNTISVTKEIMEDVHFTGSVTLGVAAGARGLAKQSTIDLPYIYPRLAVYYSDAVIKMRTAAHSKISKQWGYTVSGDMFLMPGATGDFAVEHSIQLEWNKHSGFSLLAGYKMIYGEYPFGTQAHIFPAFDMVWRSE